MSSYKYFSFFVVLVLSNISWAEAPDIRTGWWKYQVETKTASGQLEAAIEQAKAALANMPPEQKAMMEQMMKGRGMDFDLQNQSFETCIDEDDVKRMEMPKPDENCTQAFKQVAKNKYRLTMSCNGNPPTKGTGDFEIIDRKTFKGIIQMETSINGQPEKMTMVQNGSWVSDACKGDKK